MIDVCDGMATGFWMSISARGLFVLRGVNDAQMSVEEIRISPRQFAAMARNDCWMCGAEWREVPTQRETDAVAYWADVMRDWGMDPERAYETFEGDLPAAVARRLGLLRGATTQHHE